MTDVNKALSGEALHKFLLLFRYLRRYSRQMTSHGIKPRLFSVLLFLAETEQATVGQVQEYLYQSASTTSTVIGELEAAGYVTRTRSAEDNRVVIVTLTEAGQQISQKVPLGGIPLLRRRLDRLPQERLELINQALADIIQLMEVKDTE